MCRHSDYFFVLVRLLIRFCFDSFDDGNKSNIIPSDPSVEVLFLFSVTGRCKTSEWSDEWCWSVPVRAMSDVCFRFDCWFKGPFCFAVRSSGRFFAVTLSSENWIKLRVQKIQEWREQNGNVTKLQFFGLCLGLSQNGRTVQSTVCVTSCRARSRDVCHKKSLIIFFKFLFCFSDSLDVRGSTTLFVSLFVWLFFSFWDICCSWRECAKVWWVFG